jgi:3-dehydroquinate dehydratase-1
MTPVIRRELYRQFLPVAGMVDVELRWAGRLRDVTDEARRGKVGVVLSHHDFKRTPPVAKLHELAGKAADAGADIFKVATMTRCAEDFLRLVDFLVNEKRLPLAVMGMGEYGKISRLALAAAGSVLNYGYLGTPNASGQWPVKVLKERIAESAR